MRAMQLTSLGQPLGLRNIDVPTPAAGEVLLRIHTCGLNFGDTLMIKGSYQEKPALPVTLGMEMAGTVHAVGEGVNANGQRNMIGRVTSTYYSPTLDRGIAMGLVLHGPDLMGEVLAFPRVDGTVAYARIVSPVFYDPEGEKQNV